jgi:hypothetical protein
MQESYRKGIAIPPDPESCMANREVAIEALTGAHVGRVLSCLLGLRLRTLAD